MPVILVLVQAFRRDTEVKVDFVEKRDDRKTRGDADFLYSRHCQQCNGQALPKDDCSDGHTYCKSLASFC